MAALLARLRNEPAVLAAVVAIATTLGVSVPAGQTLNGVVLSVVQAVLGLVVRHFVSPVHAAPVVVKP